MRRTLLFLLLAAGIAFPQIATPRLGFVRLSDGTVRALQGVAGTFSLGVIIFRDASQVWFDGRHGVAITSNGPVAFDAAGSPQRRSERSQAVDIPGTGATWSGDEVAVDRTGYRARLPFAVRSVERVGAEYVLISGDGERRLLRTGPGREALYEIPEVAR
jgi:hypothetical protein